jgi:hypothetical protein
LWLCSTMERKMGFGARLCLLNRQVAFLFWICSCSLFISRSLGVHLLEYAQTRGFINMDCRPGRKSMLFQSTGGWMSPFLYSMPRYVFWACSSFFRSFLVLFVFFFFFFSVVLLFCSLAYTDA